MLGTYYAEQVRYYDHFQRILQRKIDSKISPGRRRTSWLANLKTWFYKSSVELFQNATDRACVSMMIAKIRD